jgi:hypothetical protein
MRGVRPLAPAQVDELERPLPPGWDYRPAALFLFACQAAGAAPGRVVPFAAAIHAVDLACRPLARLLDLEDHPPPRGPDDPRTGDGMRLLLSDGLLILAHGFLPGLEPDLFQALSPVLVEHLELLPPRIEESPGPSEALLEAQRLLARMAACAVTRLPGVEPGAGEAASDLVDRVDGALAGWRGAGEVSGRAAALERLDAIADSVAGDGARGGALARYVSLVRGALDLTSGPGGG